MNTALLVCLSRQKVLARHALTLTTTVTAGDHFLRKEITNTRAREGT